ncbi:hypothetical protein SAY86_016106 [Trapa natans]|uniref:Cyclic nucleotide-binding domain-containing protein n=1 Tax=Trapa natans TaxID=22666 RepID=A0AAN7LCF7_TRANT|nr:hypothetical protein SAY86_016106 [Trapa natans]
MNDCERDEIPMLSAAQGQSSAGYEDPPRRPVTSRTRSASMSIPSNSDAYQNLAYLAGHTGPLRSERKITLSTMSGPLYGAPRAENFPHLNQGMGGRKGVELAKQKYPSLIIKEQNNWPGSSYMGKNEHLLRSGQLGMCNDPYCTTCPSYYNSKEAKRKIEKSSGIFDPFHNSLYGDAKGWVMKFSPFISTYITGVMNPHFKVVQWWSKFFVISCLVAVFVDPLFFFLLGVLLDNKCIILNRKMMMTIVALRSLIDFIYLLHILLQFRLAYVAPESRVVGAGDLVDHPRKIALNYLLGYFFLDLFIVLPLPQIMILIVIPRFRQANPANNAKNLLRAAVLIQYIPRLFRVLPMLAGQSPSGFVFESAWANFVINLLTFILSGHVIGSCWYLFGLQRVNQCLRDACSLNGMCDFMDCGDGNKIHDFHNNNKWNEWKNNINASNCFSQDGFSYGIYQKAVNLTTEESIITRYFYSLFWGFQQISTLAGNQVPSYFVGEVLFTMAIIILGLLLFALLVGNMQNFLQALGKRRLERSLRGHDVELWMSHRRLPEELRRRVRQAERYNWAATRGVNEEMLLENLPEDLQKDIRRHRFNFLQKVWIFAYMDVPIKDAVCEKLRQKTYIQGSKILDRGGLIEKMVFIVRGKMVSDGDNDHTELSEGDVCGEELLAWCLENSSTNKDVRWTKAGHRLYSSRTVECLTNVEAFTLRAADLEEVTRDFARFLRNPRVQGAIRYISPYWRSLAATRIQVAWRYRKKCLSRVNTSQSQRFIR